MKFSDEQVGQLKSVIKEVVQDELTPIRKDVHKIRKDLTFVVDVLDNADIELRQRVDRIEKILKISKTS